MAERDLEGLSTKFVSVSSDDKTTGESTSQFHYDLGSHEGLHGIKGIALKTCSFYNTFYNVTASNNQVDWHEEPGGMTQSFTITPGFYNASQLASAIQNGINATVPVSTAVLTFDSKTGTLFFSHTGGGSGNTIEITSTISTTIGITADVTSTTVPTSFPDLVQLGGITEIFIRIPELSDGQWVKRQGVVENAIAKIQVTSGFLGAVHYDAPDESLQSIIYDSVRDVSRLTVSVSDRNGDIVDLKKSAFKFSFKIWSETRG